MAAIYKGSKHRDLAKVFMSYLTSDEYNQCVMRDVDSIPPIPKYTDSAQPQFSDAYLKPANYPWEWVSHQGFGWAVRHIGVSDTWSPFLLPSEAGRIENLWLESFMNDRCTAEQAAAGMQKEINQALDDNMRRHPELRERYDKAVALQQRINALRQAGKPEPLSWISNPFYRRYYNFKGWISPEVAP